jgi:ubiquinone/menaquinone biosynthesis C-methylase UbiE
MIQFRCPDCGGSLDESAGGLRCAVCTAEWPLRDGVPVLTAGAVVYPKEYVTPEQFETWLDDISRQGWEKAAERLSTGMASRGQKARSVARLSFDVSRADFHHLVPLEPNDVVLDYGAGLGSILFGLQPHAGHVVGLDQSLYRARLIRRRAEAIGAGNVTAVCGGNSSRLPFEDSTFNLVVMNGVLEWTPRAQAGNPVEVHRRVLREVARVLKPGGALYLAIENRYGYRYLWGRRDSHNEGKKLPYVTVIPRLAADLYTRAVSGVPYRTWLHSYRGLRGLLGECGFDRASFFFPYPTYNHFKYFIPVDGPAADERRVNTASRHVLRHEPLSRRERWALRTFTRLGVLKHLAQDFAVIARTEAPAA